MSRLVGKKKNSVVYLGLGLIITGAVALEYFGVIDLIDGFGQKPQVNNTSTRQPVKTNKPVN
jgi:hypothetical protein